LEKDLEQDHRGGFASYTQHHSITMPSVYEYEQLATDFRSLFGAKKQYLDTAWLKKLQHSSWLGQTCMSMRGLSWRVLLGLLPLDMTQWPQTMEKLYQDYEHLKTLHLPDINQVKVDPLSGMFSAEEERGGDWDAYYKVSLTRPRQIHAYINECIYLFLIYTYCTQHPFFN
jgi:hypothetical protein